MTDHNEDPLRYAAEVVGQDPFARLLGIRVDEVRESYARLSVTVKREYLNIAHRTHGGVLFSLADQAFAVAVHSRGINALAAEIKINYFQATGLGEVVVAEATPVDVRKRLSLWNIDVRVEEGERVAFAQGMAYHFI